MLTIDRRKNDYLFVALLFLAAILMGMGVFLASRLGGKWMVAILAGLVVAWIAAVSGNLKKFFLIAFIFLIPINADVHFTYDKFAASAKGFSLSACDLAMFALYFLWMVDILTNHAVKVRYYPKITLPFLGIIVLAALSSLRTFDPGLSLYEIVGLIKVFLYYFYFANNLQNEKELKLIVFFLLLGVLLQTPITFAQRYLGITLNLKVLGETRHSLMQDEIGSGTVSRVGGTLGHPNILGGYLASILILALGVFFYNTKARQKNFSLLVLITGIYSLVLTLSRAGWVSFFLAAFFIVAYYTIKRKGIIPMMGMLILCFLVLALFSIPFYETIRSRLIEDDYGAAYSRIPMMQVAFNIIREHPFLGIGINNYIRVMHEYDNTSLRITYQVRNPVHNMFLLLAAETGIFSLLFFLLVSLIVIKNALRVVKEKDGFVAVTTLTFLGALIAYYLHASVNCMTITGSPLWGLLMGVLTAIGLNYESLNKKLDI